jgi:uncharacterized coiled-coil DUF342 family protein
MTQNTQTAAERIRDIIEDHIDAIKAAQKIAAEIDALTRERDEARAEVATLTLKLANARLNLKHCSEEVDKRDECAGQLAESRAEVESCRKAYAQMRSTEDEWKRDTLAALKAEVERLRPAAALGDAYLASINEDADDNDVADLQDALEVAADRAREAAKGTP